MSLSFNEKYVRSFADGDLFGQMKEEALKASEKIVDGTGAGNDYIGWRHLPYNYDPEEFRRILVTAEEIRRSSEIFVVIGIGGSYLGARAAIEFVNGSCFDFDHRNAPAVYFVGNSLSSEALADLLDLCDRHEFSINVISKSGTTTEPAVAFRLFRELAEKKYGTSAKDRIYATTDKRKGTLKNCADKEGWKTFVVPDDIGGRYSVLTAVGLLPMAVAGIDIEAVMSGARGACDRYFRKGELNDCLRYAAYRNMFLRQGKSVEIMVSYEPSLQMFSEWWKQLYGESEGKGHKGLFPASVVFSTDLHSLGQFIQDGSRIMFETVLNVKKPGTELTVPYSEDDSDGLNYLAGKTLTEVNKAAMLATAAAHLDGGVPSIMLDISDRSEETLGELIYFFELACAISGYMLGVNPFDQPGVEAYKKNMFALLDKPGYSEQHDILLKKIETL